MTIGEPWTIESIRDALGSPTLAQRFLGEINKAPAHQLLTVFAKWERIAKDTVAASERADEIIAAEARGEEPPGQWIDGTRRIQEAAARIRPQGAA
ncbi:hypothetical protein GCM10010277_84120 [Streptomyces longisporoflavus]|uniref:hypothetical protein n=1 Tax=Streptomyces longisporoflavus TaxID=28044 RepID=UPI0019B2C7D8|nr:hypothetical protein [Streptomyces longisporoflavus]GGV71838.1 hypothetical protein GCM10010277_84120 [Streptomyces longisporoflavus]